MTGRNRGSQIWPDSRLNPILGFMVPIRGGYCDFDIITANKAILMQNTRSASLAVDFERLQCLRTFGTLWLMQSTGIF